MRFICNLKNYASFFSKYPSRSVARTLLSAPWAHKDGQLRQVDVPEVRQRRREEGPARAATNARELAEQGY